MTLLTGLLIASGNAGTWFNWFREGVLLISHQKGSTEVGDFPREGRLIIRGGDCKTARRK